MNSFSSLLVKHVSYRQSPPDPTHNQEAESKSQHLQTVHLSSPFSRVPSLHATGPWGAERIDSWSSHVPTTAHRIDCHIVSFSTTRRPAGEGSARARSVLRCSAASLRPLSLPYFGSGALLSCFGHLISLHQAPCLIDHSPLVSRSSPAGVTVS